MLKNVLLDDFIALTSRLPRPDLIKEDVIKIALTDSEVVSYQLSCGESREAVGILYEVSFKKAWTSKGLVWVFV